MEVSASKSSFNAHANEDDLTVGFALTVGLTILSYSIMDLPLLLSIIVGAVVAVSAMIFASSRKKLRQQAVEAIDPDQQALASVVRVTGTITICYVVLLVLAFVSG